MGEVLAAPAHESFMLMESFAERWIEENGVKARLGAGPRPERQG